MNELTPECRSIANYIIEQINQFNIDKNVSEQVIMTVKRLQKLLYFCDIQHMKRNNGTPLFTDNFKAWPSGPVIDAVYDNFLEYKSGMLQPDYAGLMVNLSDEIKNIIIEVLAATKDLDTMDLINITNIENGPWKQVYIENDKLHHQIISKQEMYNFYENRNTFTNKIEEPSDIKQEKNIMGLVRKLIPTSKSKSQMK